MKFTEIKRVEKPGYKSITYKASSPLSVECILKILNDYQKGDIVLYYCATSSFTESGNTKNNEFHSIEELEAVYDFPNPNIHFDAVYIHSSTGKYAFDVCTDTGADNLYVIKSDDMVEIVEQEMQERRTAENM